MRPGKEDKYLFYYSSGKGVEWKNFWFYVRNHPPSLPMRTPGAPQLKECWTNPGPDGDQVMKLLGNITKLKKLGVTGGSVVYSWMYRRIQPLQKWIHPGFRY